MNLKLRISLSDLIRSSLWKMFEGNISVLINKRVYKFFFAQITNMEFVYVIILVFSAMPIFVRRKRSMVLMNWKLILCDHSILGIIWPFSFCFRSISSQLVKSYYWHFQFFSIWAASLWYSFWIAQCHMPVV